MGPRKLRPNPKSYARLVTSLTRSKLSASLTFGILFILIATASTLICYELHYILIRTKTVAGDNLQPTPWHLFTQPIPHKQNIAARLSKIVKCNYLSCLTHTFSAPEEHKIRSNQTEVCPKFFQWIYEDLAPWRRTKISLDTLMSAQKHAAFRVTIVGGRLYTEFYYACVQPRAMFTLWGLLQLLNRYPGLVPDVDLMFDCMDRPAIKKSVYKDDLVPPPLFRYCSDNDSFDIPFPDWSFWGWPQVGILSWNEEAESIFKASKMIQWESRRPKAYWKGNPNVGSKIREELMKCNSSLENDSGTEIFQQDWEAEVKAGFKNSKLSEQCNHRFKIYAEGYAWSVSFKYIFACGSPVLVASPKYHEFFSRSLIPMVHYWPITPKELCWSIKNAVNWGNNHPTQAKEIGKEGQDFMARTLSIDHVYDYMFHLLNEYAKLQSFSPVVPLEAQIVCQNTILCFSDDQRSQDILVKSEEKASIVPPCTFAPLGRNFLEDIQRQRRRSWEWRKHVYEKESSR